LRPRGHNFRTVEQPGVFHAQVTALTATIAASLSKAGRFRLLFGK
jgi:hypothetical protein